MSFFQNAYIFWQCEFGSIENHVMVCSCSTLSPTTPTPTQIHTPPTTTTASLQGRPLKTAQIKNKCDQIYLSSSKQEPERGRCLSLPLCDSTRERKRERERLEQGEEVGVDEVRRTVVQSSSGSSTQLGPPESSWLIDELCCLSAPSTCSSELFARQKNKNNLPSSVRHQLLTILFPLQPLLRYPAGSTAISPLVPKDAYLIYFILCSFFVKNMQLNEWNSLKSLPTTSLHQQ